MLGFGKKKWLSEYEQTTFDDLDMMSFKSRSCRYIMSYIFMYVMIFISLAVYASDIYTAIVLLAFGRWSSTVQPFVPFRISRWIFAGCIILSFVILIYEFIVASTVMRSRNIALNYMNPIARNLYSIRHYRNFCLFAKITKSKSKTEYLALFTYFTLFKGWARLIFADSPRQVLNGLTIYSVLKNFSNLWQGIKTLAITSHIEAVVISVMAFSCLIWIINVSFFLFALICYPGLYVLVTDQCNGLEEFCNLHVNERLKEIVKKRKKKHLRELIKENQAGKKPTLPEVESPLDDDSDRMTLKTFVSVDAAPLRRINHKKLASEYDPFAEHNRVARKTNKVNRNNTQGTSSTTKTDSSGRTYTTDNADGFAEDDYDAMDSSGIITSTNNDYYGVDNSKSNLLASDYTRGKKVMPVEKIPRVPVGITTQLQERSSLAKPWTTVETQLASSPSASDASLSTGINDYTYGQYGSANMSSSANPYVATEYSYEKPAMKPSEKIDHVITKSKNYVAPYPPDYDSRDKVNSVHLMGTITDQPYPADDALMGRALSTKRKPLWVDTVKANRGPTVEEARNYFQSGAVKNLQSPVVATQTVVNAYLAMSSKGSGTSNYSGESEVPRNANASLHSMVYDDPVDKVRNRTRDKAIAFDDDSSKYKAWDRSKVENFDVDYAGDGPKITTKNRAIDKANIFDDPSNENHASTNFSTAIESSDTHNRAKDKAEIFTMDNSPPGKAEENFGVFAFDDDLVGIPKKNDLSGRAKNGNEQGQDRSKDKAAAYHQVFNDDVKDRRKDHANIFDNGIDRGMTRTKDKANAFDEFTLEDEPAKVDRKKDKANIFDDFDDFDKELHKPAGNYRGGLASPFVATKPPTDY